jgi:N-acetylglutamate synthase-like GNAT family acetyltransferase
VEFFGDGHEVPKVSQFDVFIHMPNIIIQCDKILDISFSSRQTGFVGRLSPMYVRDNQARIGSGSCGTHPPAIEIRALQPNEDARAFRTLNEEWITHYFALEKKDREILDDPEKTILRQGGHIFMVYVEGHAVGCVALIPLGNGVYELSKMAVSARLRGLGIGRRLLEHAITQAKVIGAKSLFLGSNTTLKNAVHLYESVGFRHVPPEKIPPMPYTRTNVFMEMEL